MAKQKGVSSDAVTTSKERFEVKVRLVACKVGAVRPNATAIINTVFLMMKEFNERIVF
jgi:hypothetical protein